MIRNTKCDYVLENQFKTLEGTYKINRHKPPYLHTMNPIMASIKNSTAHIAPPIIPALNS